MAVESKHTPKHAAPKHAAKDKKKNKSKNVKATQKDEKQDTLPGITDGTSDHSASAAVTLVTEASAQAEDATPKRKRKLWKIPVVAAGLLAGVYLVGVGVFSTVFLPGTTVDGTSVSLQSTSSLASAKNGTFDGYSIKVEGEGLDFAIDAADIDLAFDGTEYASKAIASTNPWAWPLEVSSTRALAVDPIVTYDRDKLVAVIQQAIDQAASEEESTGVTKVTYDQEKHTFTAPASQLTSQLDAGLVADAVSSHFATLDDSAEIGSDCVTGESPVRAAIDKANSYLAATLDLTVGGNDAVSVTADQIAQWVKVGDDYSVTLDTDAINYWCHNDLSQQTDSLKTERTYTRPDGLTETVAAGKGVYGWSIDGEAAATSIAQALEAGQPTTIDLPTLSQADSYNPGGKDWPDRYIDLDISDQHATFFDGDEVIWEADVVTGQPNLGHETPAGVWTITSRRTNTTLTGPNDESGNPEWVSQVDFWMGVVGNLMGFHNAPWRSSFGGTIYQYNGSHGCINLSYEKGEELYNLVKVGDVVVIHE